MHVIRRIIDGGASAPVGPSVATPLNGIPVFAIENFGAW